MDKDAFLSADPEDFAVLWMGTLHIVDQFRR